MGATGLAGQPGVQQEVARLPAVQVTLPQQSLGPEAGPLGHAPRADVGRVDVQLQTAEAEVANAQSVRTPSASAAYPRPRCSATVQTRPRRHHRTAGRARC